MKSISDETYTEKIRRQVVTNKPNNRLCSTLAIVLLCHSHQNVSFCIAHTFDFQSPKVSYNCVNLHGTIAMIDLNFFHP